MTDVAIVTTTIHVPEVLRTYAALPEKPLIIVAGDVNTPPEAAQLVHDLDGMYIHPDEQAKYKCSDIIGWKSIQRRNIAILEAIRAKADVIITVDDDNAPVNSHFIRDHVQALTERITKMHYTDCGWLNPLARNVPRAHARGIPYWPERLDADCWQRIDYNGRELRVGVSQSFVMGDPDTDAFHRITENPGEVTGYDDDVVVLPKIWAPINSQATAWRRQLAPLMAVLPGPGLARWDDIWGGLIAQRIFWDRDFCVAFGEPLVRQDRNEHDLLRDVEQELHGLRHQRTLTDQLAAMTLPHDILSAYLEVARVLEKEEWFPEQTVAFMRAWTEDCASVR